MESARTLFMICFRYDIVSYSQLAGQSNLAQDVCFRYDIVSYSQLQAADVLSVRVVYDMF